MRCWVVRLWSELSGEDVSEVGGGPGSGWSVASAIVLKDCAS